MAENVRYQHPELGSSYQNTISWLLLNLEYAKDSSDGTEVRSGQSIIIFIPAEQRFPFKSLNCFIKATKKIFSNRYYLYV